MVVLAGVPVPALAETESNDSLATAQSIAVGTTESATFTPGEQDWFAFDATRGQSVVVQLSSSAFLDVHLRNPDGASLDTNLQAPTLSDPLGATIDRTGTHYVQVLDVTGAVTTPVAYTVTVRTLATDGDEPNDRPADATAIALNTTRTGTLRPNDEDWYTVSLQEGQLVQVVGSQSPGGSGRFFVELFNESGAQVASSPSLRGVPADTVVASVTATASGTHYLQVAGDRVFVTNGTYSLSVATPPRGPDEPNDRLADAVPYALGTMVNGAVTPGDEDLFAFQAEGGRTVEVVATTASTSPNRLLFELDSGFVSPAPGETARFNVTLGDGGTHYLRVKDLLNAESSLKGYEVTVRTISAGAGVARIETPLTGTLTQGSPLRYAFTASAGESIEVTASRPATDSGSYRVVLGSAAHPFDLDFTTSVAVGTLDAAEVAPGETHTVGAAADAGGSTNATHYVEVIGDSGTFNVTVRTPANDADEPNDEFLDGTTYGVGQPVTGVLTTNDEDWYRVTVLPGVAFEVTVTRPATASGAVAVTLLGGPDEQNVTVVPGTTGTIDAVSEGTGLFGGLYWVGVDGDSGTYDLVVRTVPNGSVQLVPGVSGTGTLAAGEAASFVFPTQRGEYVSVSVTRPPGDPGSTRVRLANDTGPLDNGWADETVAAGGTATLGAMTETDGHLYVVLDGDGGGYDLVVRVTPAAAGEPNERPRTATPIAVGQTLSGTVLPGDTDSFAVNLTAGETVELVVSASGSAGAVAVVGLVDPTGDSTTRVLTPGDRVVIGETVETTGTHYVGVFPGAEPPAGYEFLVRTWPASDPREPNDRDRLSLVTETTPWPIEGGLLLGDRDQLGVIVEDGRTLTANVSLAPDATTGATVGLVSSRGRFLSEFAILELTTLAPGETVRLAAVTDTYGFDDLHRLVVATPQVVRPSSGQTLPSEPLARASYVADIRIDGVPLGRIDGGVPPGDRFERNDGFDAATPLGPGVYANLSVGAADRDYFAVNLTAGDRLDVTVRATNGSSAGNLTLNAFDPGRELVARATTPNTTGELSVTHVTAVDGTYYVVVTGDPVATDNYTVSLAVTDGIGLAVGPGLDALIVNGTRTYDVVVTGLGTDVGSFDLTVVSSNGSVVTVTAATAVTGTANVTVASDGAQVRITVPNATVSPDTAVVLARVTVRANSPGRATVSLAATPTVRSSTGLVLPASVVGGTDVTVGTAGTVTMFPGGIPGSSTGAMPTDTDGDGKLDDMTGDGRFTFQDVIEFVFALDNIAGASLTAAELAALDQDDSGQINFVDVIDLVFQL